MASWVDSGPVFQQRAKVIGVSDTDLAILVNSGISKKGLLAFAINYVPGAPDDKLFTDFLTRVFQHNAPSAALTSQMRRLFFRGLHHGCI